MQELQRENELLRQYISTLECENQSKNKERQILTEQLEHVKAQLQMLNRKQLLHSKTCPTEVKFYEPKHQKQRSAAQQQLRRQIRNKDQELLKFSQQMSLYQTIISKITKSLKPNSQKRTFAQQLNYLTQTCQNLLVENSQIKQEIYRIEQQNHQLVNALEERDLNQQNNKYELFKDWQRQFNKDLGEKFDGQIRKYQNEIIRKNQELDALKSQLYSSTGDKKKEERQLLSTVNDLQHDKNKLQKEKISLQNKIRELQNQLIEKSSLIMKLKMNASLEETYQTNLAVKQKEVKTLTVLNSNLRDEIDQLNQIIKRQDDQLEQFAKLLKEMEQRLKDQSFHKSEENQQKERQYAQIIMKYEETIARMEQEIQQLKSRSTRSFHPSTGLRSDRGHINQYNTTNFRKQEQNLHSENRQSNYRYSDYQSNNRNYNTTSNYQNENQLLNEQLKVMINTLKKQINQNKANHKLISSQSSYGGLMPASYQVQNHKHETKFDRQNYNITSPKKYDAHSTNRYYQESSRLQSKANNFGINKYQSQAVQYNDNGNRVSSRLPISEPKRKHKKQYKQQGNRKNEGGSQWQRLQKKINSLKHQNDLLKKSFI